MPMPKPKGKPRVPSPVEEAQEIVYGERSHTLYRMFDEAGDLLYVGRSSRGPRRFGEHRADQRRWRSVATITLEHFGSAAEVETAERKAIKGEGPRFNVVHASSGSVRDLEGHSAKNCSEVA